MNKMELDNILKIVSLDNELELNRANVLQLKLRVLAKNDPELLVHRKHLRNLIKEYESKNWKNTDVDDKQISLSDISEKIADNENLFIMKRKKLIISNLKQLGLNQQDLGTILGHRKSYISELLNGIRTLSLADTIAIHKLLNIQLEYLVPTFLNDEKRAMLNKNVKKLNRPNIRINKLNLDLELT